MKKAETKKIGRKMNETRAKKEMALTEISVMIIATFAFAFIISGAGVVSADITKAECTNLNGYDYLEECPEGYTNNGLLTGESHDYCCSPPVAPAQAQTQQAAGQGTPSNYMGLLNIAGSGMSIYNKVNPALGGEVWAIINGKPTKFASNADVIAAGKGPLQTYPTEADAAAALKAGGGTAGGGTAATATSAVGGVGSFFLGTGKFSATNAAHSTTTLFANTLLRSATYAAIGYGVGQLIGSMAGLESGLTNAISNALAVAGAISPALQALVQTGKLGAHGAAWATVIGIGIVALVFILSYKKERYEIITFNCEPWEAPVGGKNCEQCNKNSLVPCSEYRCKSLGQACAIVNAGTAEQKCFWNNSRDVSAPTITPWIDALKPTGLQYKPDTSILPPNLGVKIVNPNGVCLEPYTALQFGLSINEPAACKIDYNHTAKFEDMQYDFGETNYLLYNHTQKLRLPGVDGNGSFNSPLLTNDGTMTLYARCRDANGNSNAAEFAISFCVKPTPDVTPPIIEGSSLVDGSPVMHDADNTTVDIYVNEPAECKWSSQDGRGYKDMENPMVCANNPEDINADLQWVCSGTLTGIVNEQASKYYFKCKDINENEMVSSYPLTIRGTRQLNMINTGPNGTIFGSTTTVSVDLTAETDDGSDEGKAVCSFSPTGETGSYTEMFETNACQSDKCQNKQNLGLPAGDYTYYFSCTDAGGNSAEGNTTFSVFVDKAAPIVTRAYKQEPDALKLVTNEEAECVYSLTTCNYVFEDAVKSGLTLINQPALGNKIHFIEWKAGTIYYIKCQDKYGNEPSPNECSIIASPSEIKA